MAAAVTLQRSVTSFRRQGSSGVVWDEKFVSSELNVISTNKNHKDGEENINNKKNAGLKQSLSDGSARIMMMRCPTRAGVRNQLPPQHLKAARVLPQVDTSKTTPPPSPKNFRGCGFRGIFGISRGVKKITDKRITNTSGNKCRS